MEEQLSKEEFTKHIIQAKDLILNHILFKEADGDVNKIIKGTPIIITSTSAIQIINSYIRSKIRNVYAINMYKKEIVNVKIEKNASNWSNLVMFLVTKSKDNKIKVQEIVIDYTDFKKIFSNNKNENLDVKPVIKELDILKRLTKAKKPVSNITPKKKKRKKSKKTHRK